MNSDILIKIISKDETIGVEETIIVIIWFWLNQALKITNNNKKIK